MLRDVIQHVKSVKDSSDGLKSLPGLCQPPHTLQPSATHLEHRRVLCTVLPFSGLE